jgi:hypothetical protein
MPSLTTATFAPALFSRSARTSGQRWLASTVEPSPSVIESPKVTTARASGAASTRISLRNSRDVMVCAGWKSGAPVWSPSAEM